MPTHLGSHRGLCQLGRCHLLLKLSVLRLHGRKLLQPFLCTAACQQVQANMYATKLLHHQACKYPGKACKQACRLRSRTVASEGVLLGQRNLRI